MGHEMGHYVLGHVWQLVLLGTVLALFGALGDPPHGGTS